MQLFNQISNEVYRLPVLPFPAQETNERLERLQTAVDQLQRAGHTCYTMTGSFHSPAHNCSHIAQEHPNATSGKNVHFIYWYILCGVAGVCGNIMNDVSSNVIAPWTLIVCNTSYT